MHFLKRFFCGHYISTELCKIEYNNNSTKLIYQKICKDCGKKIGKERIKIIDKHGNTR